MKVEVKNKNITIAKNIKIANSFTSRLKGLMFLKEMKGFDGLLIKKCNSIHNCFVKFPIDAVFMNNDFEIVKILRNFKPWRFSGIYLRATQVLELNGGSLSEDVSINDVLEVTNV